MKKQNKRILMIGTAAVAGFMTAYTVTKETTKNKDQFKKMLKDQFDVTETNLMGFAFSLPSNDFWFITSIANRLMGSKTLRNDIVNAMNSVHAPGNKTSNEIVSCIMKHLNNNQKQQLLSFIDTYRTEIRELFHIHETMDMKDFTDWLDYYYSKGRLIDKALIKRVAKLADVTVNKIEMERLEDTYA